jgi:hypothetical protein
MKPTSDVVVGEATGKEVEQAVIEWLRTELDDPEITGSDNFLDIGGHSLTFLRLNKFLGAGYGVALDQRTTYHEELGVAVAAMHAGEQNAT